MIWYFRTTGNAGATAQRAISGINAVLQLLGYGINLHNYNSESLVRTAKGIDNIRARYKIGRKRVIRRALINCMLDQMLVHMDANVPFMRIMRGVILFEKQTGFRAHNVVMTGHGGFVRIRHLKFHPSIDNPSHVIVTLPYSKTKSKYDPEWESRTLRCRCNEGLCAVHEVADIVRDRQRYRYQAVFLMPDVSPVTYSTLNKTLKALCNLFGLNAEHYTSHALRYGQATDLHFKNWTIPGIMKWMGWLSRKSAMRYIRPDNPDFVQFGFSP